MTELGMICEDCEHNRCIHMIFDADKGTITFKCDCDKTDIANANDRDCKSRETDGDDEYSGIICRDCANCDDIRIEGTKTISKCNILNDVDQYSFKTYYCNRFCPRPHTTGDIIDEIRVGKPCLWANRSMSVCFDGRDIICSMEDEYGVKLSDKDIDNIISFLERHGRKAD